MPSPRNLQELRSLPGRLQPLISKARTRCQSFSRQDANFVWTPKQAQRKRFLFLLILFPNTKLSKNRCTILYYIWKWNDLVDSSKTGSIISSLRRINENSGFFLKTRDVKAIDIQSMVSGSLVLAHRTSRSVPYWVKACRSKGKKKYRMLNHYCQKSFSSRRCKTKLKSSSAQV